MDNPPFPRFERCDGCEKLDLDSLEQRVKTERNTDSNFNNYVHTCETARIYSNVVLSCKDKRGLFCFSRSKEAIIVNARAEKMRQEPGYANFMSKNVYEILRKDHESIARGFQQATPEEYKAIERMAAAHSLKLNPWDAPLFIQKTGERVPYMILPDLWPIDLLLHHRPASILIQHDRSDATSDLSAPVVQSKLDFFDLKITYPPYDLKITGTLSREGAESLQVSHIALSRCDIT